MARWNHGGLTRQQRGYCNQWLKLRASILASEPLCRICAVQGRVTAATQVDHVVPFRGIADPARLDRSNLRPVCADHHMQITSAAARGQRLRITGPDGWPHEV